jgi:hypothetical protein
MGFLQTCLLLVFRAAKVVGAIYGAYQLYEAAIAHGSTTDRLEIACLVLLVLVVIQFLELHRKGTKEDRLQQHAPPPLLPPPMEGSTTSASINPLPGGGTEVRYEVLSNSPVSSGTAESRSGVDLFWDLLRYGGHPEKGSDGKWHYIVHRQ